MFSILSFLQGGDPIFENGGISKKQMDDLYREGIKRIRKLCHIQHKGPLNEVVSACMSVF